MRLITAPEETVCENCGRTIFANEGACRFWNRAKNYWMINCLELLQKEEINTRKKRAGLTGLGGKLSTRKKANFKRG
jgi:hypothetical protein